MATIAPPITTTSRLDAAIEQLAPQVRGDLIRPGNETYEASRRVYNAMIDRRPALIVRAADVHVDPKDRTARVGGGATWGDVDHATHTFGLAIPAASSRRQASAVSPSVEALAISLAATVSRPTISSPPTS